jgi:hypothetical protein
MILICAAHSLTEIGSNGTSRICGGDVFTSLRNHQLTDLDTKCTSKILGLIPYNNHQQISTHSHMSDQLRLLVWGSAQSSINHYMKIPQYIVERIREVINTLS